MKSSSDNTSSSPSSHLPFFLSFFLSDFILQLTDVTRKNLADSSKNNFITVYRGRQIKMEMPNNNELRMKKLECRLHHIEAQRPKSTWMWEKRVVG